MDWKEPGVPEVLGAALTTLDCLCDKENLLSCLINCYLGFPALASELILPDDIRSECRAGWRCSDLGKEPDCPALGSQQAARSHSLAVQGEGGGGMLETVTWITASALLPQAPFCFL